MCERLVGMSVTLKCHTQCKATQLNGTQALADCTSSTGRMRNICTTQFDGDIPRMRHATRHTQRTYNNAACNHIMHANVQIKFVSYKPIQPHPHTHTDTQTCTSRDTAELPLTYSDQHNEPARAEQLNQVSHTSCD